MSIFKNISSPFPKTNHNNSFLKNLFFLFLSIIIFFLFSHSNAHANNFESVNDITNKYDNGGNSHSKLHHKIGVLASRGKEKCLEEWGPTAEYLSKKLSPMSFEIIPLSFSEIYDAIQKSEICLIAINPSYYAYFEYNGLAHRIATMQNKGEGINNALYGGVIFTRKDRNDIDKLTDLRSKSFGAVDSNSFGGWQVALREIIESGINPSEDFTSLKFYGSHDKVVEAVLKGEVSAGTVRSSQLERMSKEKIININDIKIINNQKNNYPYYASLLSTKLYPDWPIASLRNTDNELSKKVVVALLLMDENDIAAKALSSSGWTIPQDYTEVHNLLKVLNLPPYENYGKVTLKQAIKQYWFWISLVLILFVISVLFAFYNSSLNQKNKKYLSELLKLNNDLLASKKEIELNLTQKNILIHELTRTKDELEIANSTKDKFFSIISHDLRSPFQGFIGITESLSQNISEYSMEDIVTYLTEINKKARSIFKLLKNLLDWARMQKDSIEFNPRVITLYELVSKTINQLSDAIENKKIAIKIDFKEDLKVLVDHNMIESVLRNLISNAIKFSYRNSQIIISSRKSANDYVEVCVEDFGVGMEEKTVAKLFKIEERVGSHGTEGEESTGLGLILCKEFIEKHNGKIWVESKLDAGSKFIFTIPGYIS